MKLRFENNSIRFRIRKSEILHLQQHGFIKDEITFPNNVFSYELSIKDIPEVTPEFSNNKVVIYLPLIKAKHWIESDEVGIYRLIDIDKDEALDIIIEKDFPCKDRPGEDKTDTFSELADNNNKDKVC